MPFLIWAREWFSSTNTRSLVTTGRAAVPATDEVAVGAGAVWAGAVLAGAGDPVRELANRATGARTRARRNHMRDVSVSLHRGLERAAVCRDRSRGIQPHEREPT